MTDSRIDPDLRRALDAATAHLSPPDLTVRALEEARHRRSARRAAVAGVAAAALVAALVGWDLSRPPADLGDGPTPTPTPTPAPTSTPTAPVTPPETDEAKMGSQPVWDPFTVTEAPRGDSVLPVRLEPPASAVSVLDEPVESVVLAWPEEGHDLRVLSADGQWRAVPGTASLAPSALRDVVTPAISSDGRLLAFSAEDGLWVVDVTEAERRVIPWPDEIAGPWDTLPGVRWLPGDDEVLVEHWRTSWVVGLDGTDRAAHHLRFTAGMLAIDPDGPVLQRRWRTGRIVEWRDARVVHRVDDGIVWGERMVAGHGLVVLTGGLGGGSFAGPIVIDSATGERVAYAPVRDRGSVYSDNGYLTAQGFLDQDTILLLVGPMSFRTMQVGEETWHLVAWDFTTGAFELLSSGRSAMRGIEVVAPLVAK